MNWSHFQKDIYHAFGHGGDSLLVEAVAGSGKTTVLVELSRIMQWAFPQQRGVFLAFNKSIAIELQARLDAMWVAGPRGPNVQAMTLHSAGWAAWRRAGGLDWEPTVDNLKVSKIMREVLSYEENKRFGETTRKLVSAARGIGLVPDANVALAIVNREPRPIGLVPDTPEAWESLIDHYSLDEDACSIDCVRKVLARSIELARESCDFDDMLYMPVVAGVPFDRYDVVLVDEAQDVSGIQMEMIARMTARPSSCCQGWMQHDITCMSYGQPKPITTKSRIIAVGDRAQAIYGFRGAGTTSMDEMKQRFGMRELPLSVTYRCPQVVVEHARRWVSQIEARENAPWGYVGLEGTDWRGQAEVALGAPRCTCPEFAGACECLSPEYRAEGITKWRGISDFQPGDAILCRLTRPLVAAAFQLIRARIPGVHVLGRDIGGGLVAIVKKAKFAPAAPLEQFDRWLEDYEAREVKRLTGKGKHAQAGLLRDKAETIRVFMEQLGEDSTVQSLIAEIERLFVDANGGTARMVTLATVHKAKGLEWERVFVLDAGELMPCPWARGGGWEMQQERNLMYVAATRAMRELRYITTGDLR